MNLRSGRAMQQDPNPDNEGGLGLINPNAVCTRGIRRTRDEDDLDYFEPMDELTRRAPSTRNRAAAAADDDVDDDDVMIVDVKWASEHARLRAAAGRAINVMDAAGEIRRVRSTGRSAARPIPRSAGGSSRLNSCTGTRFGARSGTRHGTRSGSSSASGSRLIERERERALEMNRRKDFGVQAPIKKRTSQRRVFADITNRARAAAASTSPVKQPECGICLMAHEAKDIHTLASCDHGYCSHCLCMYLKTEVRGTKYPITCPGCDVGKKKLLDTAKCDGMLRDNGDSKTADALGVLDAKHIGLKNPKFCSNPECAMVFDYEGDGDRRTARIDCPMCRTSTCVLCNAKWHKGGCERSKEELELLKNENFNECPGCSSLVERIDGCNFIKCRCGVGFCFHCGTAYQSVVPTSKNSHGIPGCNCAIYQGTRYEGAVQIARNRHREWLASVSPAEKGKPNWKEISQAKFNTIFNEEYRRVRDVSSN